MTSMPITIPIILPKGPALLKKELPVTTKEPQPIAVPTDKPSAPSADTFLLFNLSILFNDDYNFWFFGATAIISSLGIETNISTNSSSNTVPDSCLIISIASSYVFGEL